MKLMLDKFYAFLDRPLFGWSRLLLALLVIPLVLSFGAPLWRIELKAPQYPKGLTLDIYSYKLEGGHRGQDIHEVNTLNHYIGMRKIDRTELADLDWMPFALSALVLLTLRVAVIGNVRMLLDLVVMAHFIALFSGARFVFKLYTFGHNLDPTAPVTVEPFMPAVFGTKQIANFTTTSLPQAGTYWISVFMAGIVLISLWHLVAGRRQAVRAERAG